MKIKDYVDVNGKDMRKRTVNGASFCSMLEHDYQMGCLSEKHASPQNRSE